MFKDLVDKKRCIIPASAYFEWKKPQRMVKRKVYHRKEKSILYMAGLFNIFTERLSSLVFWMRLMELTT